MKLTLWYSDGDVRTVDVVGPLRVIPRQPDGKMEILHDEGTGWDYWFNEDGSFDGTGMSAADLTPEEAKGIMDGLKDVAEGKTKPFKQIQEELKRKQLN